MTFLKKLGNLLATGAAMATGIWPMVSGLFGSNVKAQNIGTEVVNDLTSVAQVVISTEAIIQTPGSGASKLAAATPLVANIVRTSELVAGKKIANEALFIEGCQDITSGTAKVLNSLHPDAAQTAPKP